MGQEAACRVSTDTRSGEGIAHLEPGELRFKGSFALRIPFDTITAYEAKRGKLHVTHKGGTAVFDLGSHAETWALKIRYPRGRLDKRLVDMHHDGLARHALLDHCHLRLRECRIVSGGETVRPSLVTSTGISSRSAKASLLRRIAFIATRP